MEGKTVAYIRVSSDSQKMDRQHDIMKTYCERHSIEDVTIIAETITGRTKAKDRKFNEILEDKEVTHLLVNSITRLGRRNIDIVKTIDALKSRGVKITIIRLGLSSLLDNGKKNPAFGMVTAVMAQLAEDDWEYNKERQRDGIDTQLKKDKTRLPENRKYKGRKKGASSKIDILDKYPQVVKELKKDRLSLREIKKMTGVSVNTIQKVRKTLLERA